LSYEKPSVIESLNDLKTASLISMLSRLLIDANIIVLIVYRDVFKVSLHRAFLMFVCKIAFTIIFIGIVLGLIASYAFLVPAYEGLRAFKFNAFNTAYKLIKSGYLGGFALLLIGYIFIVTSIILYVAPNALALGIILVTLAIMLLIIGHVGLAMGSIRLGDVFSKGKFTIISILFLLGALIILITPLAWMLKYITLRKIISKITSSSSILS